MNSGDVIDLTDEAPWSGCLGGAENDDGPIDLVSPPKKKQKQLDGAGDSSEVPTAVLEAQQVSQGNKLLALLRAEREHRRAAATSASPVHATARNEEEKSPASQLTGHRGVPRISVLTYNVW